LKDDHDAYSSSDLARLYGPEHRYDARECRSHRYEPRRPDNVERCPSFRLRVGILPRYVRVLSAVQLCRLVRAPGLVREPVPGLVLPYSPASPSSPRSISAGRPPEGSSGLPHRCQGEKPRLRPDWVGSLVPPKRTRVSRPPNRTGQFPVIRLSMLACLGLSKPKPQCRQVD